MKNPNRKFTIQTKITFLASALIVLSLSISFTMLVAKIIDQNEKELGLKALAIGRTVSQLEPVQQNVGESEGVKVIQPIAERIRLATDVEYVVILDMEKIRYSHPLQNKIGTIFSGGDEGPAFADNEYISRASGVLGPSIRAFIPIKAEEGTKQVGVVVVGILTPTVTKILTDIRIETYLSLVFGLMVGIVGAYFLARNIKQAMFSLEPDEIAHLLEERTAILQSISEGIIAIDKNKAVIACNEEAQRVLGYSGDPMGKPIEEVHPYTQLPRILQTGQPEFNRESIVSKTIIVTNRVPIVVKGQIVGAVSTFRDKTKIRALAEELTGVKRFVEALRVQNHEHMNKLHTIAGLIQLKQPEQAIDYIFNITEQQEELTKFLLKNFSYYNIAGLLLGKSSRAKELNIQMHIDNDSCLRQLPKNLDSNDMVLIIGNLLENAMEAVNGSDCTKREIYFSLRENPEEIIIAVEDSGPGVPMEIQEQIFKMGFSTKGKVNRGIGLFLLDQIVSINGGTIEMKSELGQGTRFTIIIPKRGKELYV